MADGLAHARAALAGNPSDGYGGAVLAVTVEDFAARASAAAGGPAVDPPSELVAATVRRFTRELRPGADGVTVRWSTSVPRGVGLGGSSAIVTATLRALCELHRVSPGPAELAELALAVETEELGIAAGLQDRVAQAYGGLTYMEFGSEPPRYEQLDAGLLPPLLVAWRPDAAQDSGVVHGSLRDRFARGEGAVVAAMGELAELARAARDALVAGDRGGFARAVDGSFDVRRRMIVLDRRHVELIERARAAGASANYTGSGGAIVAVCPDRSRLAAVREALTGLGCGVVESIQE